MDNFQIIYDSYFLDVYHYVFSLCRNTSLAEEITQETFFKALKKIDDFDGKCTLFVWLCQIAKNTYFTQYEKNKRHISFQASVPMNFCPKRTWKKWKCNFNKGGAEE